ncbi:MAG: glycosyltransferase family 4 protein [Planctomyces sp.]|nr:glycosyltransferase family 4 protein [Planctomyces sp.]
MSQVQNGDQTIYTPLRVCFVLPGLHRVNRGAETAFEAVANELAKIKGCDVTLFGMGESNPARNYQFIQVHGRPRERFERWPRMPFVRSECSWEELSFMPGLARRYRPADFDVTVTCSFPYSNWFLRSRRTRGYRPPHLYVTQNGDWPCIADSGEYRWFHCDGLVCTNPEYFERNKDRWNAVLIPNGVDPARFHSGPGSREKFGLPGDVKTVLMVSALIPSKRVLEGIEAVHGLAGVHLVIAGDGPLRAEVAKKGAELLPGRFSLLKLPREDMPDLYRSVDSFLHMSLDEPSANSYIEALSSGLPIVTHDRAVTRWTLEDCGFLTDCTNHKRVAEEIQKALSAFDSERVRRQSELVERRFTWKGIAAEYHRILTALHQRRTTGAMPE